MQVVSDIDDTLMSSGGSYPAGRDTRYPHNCVYPGVLAFYNELDAGHVIRIEVLLMHMLLYNIFIALDLQLRNSLSINQRYSYPQLFKMST